MNAQYRPLPVARIGRSLPEARCAAPIRALASPWLLAAIAASMLPSAYAAGPTPSLPTPCAGVCGSGANLNFVQSGKATYSIDPSKPTVGTVVQTTPKATLNWQDFNVGTGYTLNFQQPNASSATLNRVWDVSGNPSQIFGTIKANGDVYVVNANGVVFGKGAQVNVHSLIASTLNIDDQIFQSGLFANTDPTKAAFTAFAGGSGSVEVQPGATIAALPGGNVFLIGTKVTNGGTVSAPDGQVLMASGQSVALYVPPLDNLGNVDNSMRGLLVQIAPGDGANGSGATVNQAGGVLTADRGNVTLAGLLVKQDGTAVATTSVQANGSVYLVAQPSATATNGIQNGLVELGLGSLTANPLDPTDHATVVDSQAILPSKVVISGKTVDVAGRIASPGGNVTITATDPANTAPKPSVGDGSRVLIESTGSIDTSGSIADLSMDKNVVAVTLRGDALASSPLQRSGPLLNQTVYVDLRQGTPLVDLTPFRQAVQRGIAEKTAAGGNITITAGGDVVALAGSVLDVSGGGYRYADGIVRTSQLISADTGKLVGIANASPTARYAGVADTYTVTSAKWGTTETFLGPRTAGVFEKSYIEGKSAGTVTIAAPGSVVLDGSVRGNTYASTYQRDPSVTDPSLSSYVPQGGKLVIGANSGTYQIPGGSNEVDYVEPSIVFDSKVAALGNFAIDSALPADRIGNLKLSTSLLGANGMASLTAYSNESITVAKGATLAAQDGGQIALTAYTVDVNGNIVARAGKVGLSAVTTATHPLNDGDPSTPTPVTRVALAPGSRIDVSGRWVNDLPAVSPTLSSAPAWTAGGSIVVTGDVVVGAGSALDANGGAWLARTGTLSASGGGSIALRANQAFADGTGSATDASLPAMSAYGIANNGTLSLTAPRLTIGVGPAGTAGELALSDAFVDGGAYSSLAFTARSNGVTSGLVLAGSVAPIQQNLVLAPNYKTMTSGTELLSFARPGALPSWQRKPVNVALRGSSAGSSQLGEVRIADGAGVSLDVGGTLSLSSDARVVIGDRARLSAPAGSITVSQTNTDSSSTVATDDSQQYVWIGSGATVSVAGIDATYVDPRTGRRAGEVLDAGSIIVNAAGGSIVARPGSVIDASGATGVVDVPVRTDAGVVYRTVAAPSAGGSVTLSARNGVYLDGGVRGAGGAGTSAGGTFSLALDRGQPGSPDAIGWHTAPISLEINQSVNPTSALNTVTAGGALTLDGQGLLTADMLSRSGFDRISLSAGQTQPTAQILFNGSVSLSTRVSLALDAPNFVAQSQGGAADVALSSAAVTLSNGYTQYAAAPDLSAAIGNGTLRVSGNLVDLRGTLVLQGFARNAADGSAGVAISSAGDLRASSQFPTVGGVYGPAPGGLYTASNLDLSAQQIYPTTLSNFTFNAVGSDIRILPVAGTPGPVLSAGGRLAFAATPTTPTGGGTPTGGNIRQGGRVAAPLGDIEFNASGQLSLAAGSVTSVTAAGLAIPYGETSNGSAWYYGGTSGVIVTTPPTKRIGLNSGSVDLAKGATVDLSAGGDVRAWEFVPGPDGKTDLFAASNTYAIVPTAVLKYAPWDSDLYAASTGQPLKVGDSVYLAGGGGIAAGHYTLLPAHYALALGNTLGPVYLLTAVSGYRDLLAGNAVPQDNGGVVVAGYRAVVGTDIQGSRTSGYLVRTAAAVQNDARYTVSGADFLAQSAQHAGLPTPVLPSDAGLLSIQAQQQLSLGAALQADTLAGHLGSRVDISAGNIALVGQVNPADTSGAVQISVAGLNALHADSLLVGGSRQDTAQGSQVAVSAQTVEVRDTGGVALSAPDVTLVAATSVTLRSGASLASTASGPVADKLLLSGDSALVRVSSDATAQVSRSGGAHAAGDIAVAAGARLSGTAITLDGAHATQVDTAALLSAKQYNLSASRISLGSAPTGTNGLVLSGGLLAAAESATGLSLRSYSTIDFYGDVSLGQLGSDGKPVLRTLVLDSAGLGGYGAANSTVAVTAGRVTLRNSDASQTFATAPGATLGSGTLAIAARTVASDGSDGSGRIVIDGGASAVQGFSLATLDAPEILARGTGSLTATSNLTLRTQRLAAADAATDTSGVVIGGGARAALQTISAIGGDLILQGTAAPTLALTRVESLGGSLTLTGRTVTVSTTIDAPAGSITVQGDNGVALESGALVRARLAETAAGAGSDVVSFGVTSVPVAAGQVAVAAGTGDLTIAAGAEVDVSGGSRANAGALTLTTAGILAVAGKLDGAAAAGASGGRVTVDAGAIDFASLNAALETGGFAASRNLRVRGTADAATHDVTIASDVHARSFTLSADQGNIDVAAGIVVDASGANGGSVSLAARGNVTVEGKIDASATSSGGTAGNVTLAAGQGSGTTGNERISFGTGSVVAMNGTGGQLLLRAAQVGSGDVGVANLPANIVGTPEIDIEAFRVYTKNAAVVTVGIGPDDAQTFSIPQLQSDAAAYMAAAAQAGGAIARLDPSGNTNFHLGPGIELRNTGGDIDIVGDTTATGAVSGRVSNFRPIGWNFGADANGPSSWRYGPNADPGYLTVRATGDVLVVNSLSDGFAYAANKANNLWAIDGSTTAGGAIQRSWSFRLVGGSDLAAADVLRTSTAAPTASLTAGDVVIGANALVRTGTGSIDIAAARDFRLAALTSAVYTAGAPVDLTDMRVTTGGGSVTIAAGRDALGVDPDLSGASPVPVNDWLRRTTGGFPRPGQTSPVLLAAGIAPWWVDFTLFDGNIGALGGGNVAIAAGRDVTSLSANVATAAMGPKAYTPASTATVYNGGMLDVVAGRDLNGGQYLLGAGIANLIAGRNLGGPSGTSLYMMGADGKGGGIAAATLSAGGDLYLLGVANPTYNLAKLPPGILPTNANYRADTAFFSYAPNASVMATATSGDVSLGGTAAGASDAGSMYPGRLTAVSYEGNLNAGANHTNLVLAPAVATTYDANGNPTGRLRNNQVILLAAGDLTQPSVSVSDLDPATLPAWNTPLVVGTTAPLTPVAQLSGTSRLVVPEGGDAAAYNYEFVARDGSIVGTFGGASGLSVPGRSLIYAGLDIANMSLNLQNDVASDITRVYAGRDFYYDTGADVTQRLSGTVIGGPGRLVIQAGRDINLGTSEGIKSIGNDANPALPDSTGARLTLAAGVIGGLIDPQQVSDLLSAVEQDGVARQFGTAQQRIDKTFPATRTQPGNISIAYSQVTIDGQITDGPAAAPANGVGIDIVAPRGQVLGGLTSPVALPASDNGLGVVTTFGGQIRSYTQGDFIVNESRVETLQGGDIMMYSSHGSIDAGRGAREALSTPPPRRVTRSDGTVYYVAPAAAQGSGIRTFTSDPDGPGPLAAPVPGSVYLFAPNGTINAGDAGIGSAGNVVVFAQVVLNASQITSQGSSNVPVADTGALSAGLTGVSNAAASATKGTDDVTKRLADAADTQDKLKNSFRPSFITVEVTGMGEDDEDDGKKKRAR